MALGDPGGAATGFVLTDLLKFAQAGLAGVAVLALAFTYHLLRTVTQGSDAKPDVTSLLRRFMTFSFWIVVISGGTQIVDMLWTGHQARALDQCRADLHATRTGAMSTIEPDYVNGAWRWEWVSGDWEGDAVFTKVHADALAFAMDVFIHRDGSRELVQRFYSDPDHPIQIPDGGLSAVEFDGWRDILDNPTALKWIGPPQHWHERFRFTGGKELVGTYRGFGAGGVPVGEGGDIVLYMPP